MTPDQLLEATAKEIDPEAWGLPDNAEPSSITDRDIARDRARAVLSAVIEAAAKVADEQKNPPVPTLYLAGQHFCAVKIAAAIRALLPARKEGGE